MGCVFQSPLTYINLVLALAFISRFPLYTASLSAHRLVCLATSITALFLGCLSLTIFDQSAVGFQFLARISPAPFTNLTFTLGADGLSMIFLLLTLFVFPICFASA
jgi:NADH-quinone oxidoreductase subunit M